MQWFNPHPTCPRQIQLRGFHARTDLNVGYNRVLKALFGPHLVVSHFCRGLNPNILPWTWAWQVCPKGVISTNHWALACPPVLSPFCGEIMKKNLTQIWECLKLTIPASRFYRPILTYLRGCANNRNYLDCYQNFTSQSLGVSRSLRSLNDAHFF